MARCDPIVPGDVVTMLTDNVRATLRPGVVTADNPFIAVWNGTVLGLVVATEPLPYSRWSEAFIVCMGQAGWVRLPLVETAW